MEDTNMLGDEDWYQLDHSDGSIKLCSGVLVGVYACTFHANGEEVVESGRFDTPNFSFSQRQHLLREERAVADSMGV